MAARDRKRVGGAWRLAGKVLHFDLIPFSSTPRQDAMQQVQYERSVMSEDEAVRSEHLPVVTQRYQPWLPMQEYTLQQLSSIDLLQACQRRQGPQEQMTALIDFYDESDDFAAFILMLREVDAPHAHICASSHGSSEIKKNDPRSPKCDDHLVLCDDST